MDGGNNHPQMVVLYGIGFTTLTINVYDVDEWHFLLLTPQMRSMAFVNRSNSDLAHFFDCPMFVEQKVVPKIFPTVLPITTADFRASAMFQMGDVGSSRPSMQFGWHQPFHICDGKWRFPKSWGSPKSSKHEYTIVVLKPMVTWGPILRNPQNDGFKISSVFIILRVNSAANFHL